MATLICLATTLYPRSFDTGGVGLRVYAPGMDGPLLSGEGFGRVQLLILLINYSRTPKEHDPFVVLQQTGGLDLKILQPDGKIMPAVGGLARPRDTFTVPETLAAGHFSWYTFSLTHFGYETPSQNGKHRIEMSLRLAGQTIIAPHIGLDIQIVEPTPDAILESHEAPQVKDDSVQPAPLPSRASIQQIKLGNRVWLIYRTYHGPRYGNKISRTFRLAELPGKCEMTVEGAYGAGNPLTITYKDSPTAKPTKLVINSINGLPWTEEEERLRQERLREKCGLPPLAPPPRAVRR